MKTLLSTLFVFTLHFAFSQCQVTIQPGTAEGKDNHIFQLSCFSSYAQSTGQCSSSNMGDNAALMVGAWTHWSTHSEHRSLLEFDLDSLSQAGCTVSEAILVLTPTGNTTQYHCGSGSTVHPCLSNSFSINRVITPWDEMTSSDDNEPLYTNSVPGQDYVVVGNENDPFDTYAIDLTDMVNYWLQNPSENHGMMMVSLLNAHYQIARFASSDHVDPWRRPKLVLTTNCANTCSNKISGTVYDDISGDCNQDPGEEGLENWIVKIEPGPIYASTDANGYYEAWVGNANYTVTQMIPNNYLWDSICPLPYEHNVDLTGGGNAPGTDFAVQADQYCADLVVDIGANVLRPCHTELFYVNYCNNGNIAETGVYIDVEFDAGLSVTSASVPWTSQNGNTYTWDIGDLDPGDCGAFHVEVVVDCQANIGDLECVTATIFPPNLCTEPVSPDWDKSSVMVTGMCDDSLACFTIFNTGGFPDGNMQSPQQFRIYENGVLVHVGMFQLDGQEDTVICWPANGNSIQLQADQHPLHPGNSNPNDWVENCGTGGGSACGSVPCVLTAPANDGDPFIEQECLEVIASYDPNDKTPNPFGVDVEHFIGADDIIEYKVRFQNTGNDTAFKVVVTDKIDMDVLDINTIVLGASSHPYSFDIYGNGICRWTFNPIFLVDSATNEPESMGFFKFKIKQKEGNQPGTLIENFVDIFFDYNAPVRTDTAYNTIEYPSELLNVPYYHQPEADLSVYPNPAQNFVTFEIGNLPEGNYTIRIMDAQGRLVKETDFYGLKTQIDLSDLNRGIYLYQLVSTEEMLASGKLVVSQ